MGRYYIMWCRTPVIQSERYYSKGPLSLLADNLHVLASRDIPNLKGNS